MTEGKQLASVDGSKRVITYFANFDMDRLSNSCDQLVDACSKGYLTHILVGLFHLAWMDQKQTIPGIHLNKMDPHDPDLIPLWQAVIDIQNKYPQVKVLITFGGGGVGDFRQLLNPETFGFWYPPLKNMLNSFTFKFDGIDLDIEEDDDDAVNTENVQRLVGQLHQDFPGFLVTSAPVASALIDSTFSVSRNVDYIQLLQLGLFDWYNAQFYNNFGDLINPDWDPPFHHSPDYALVTDNLLRNGLAPNKLVALVPTEKDACATGYHDILSELFPMFWKVTVKYPDFGGVGGWHFDCAMVGDQTDPVGWTHYAFMAQHGELAALNP